MTFVLKLNLQNQSNSTLTWDTYTFLVRLAAVIPRGHISDAHDVVSPTGLWVHVVTLEVSKAGEDFLDCGWMVADDVGGFGNVVAIAERKHLIKILHYCKSPPKYWYKTYPEHNELLKLHFMRYGANNTRIMTSYRVHTLLIYSLNLFSNYILGTCKQSSHPTHVS